jgi:hypothetical protein
VPAPACLDNEELVYTDVVLILETQNGGAIEFEDNQYKGEDS